jgi:hypothetical protein
MEDGPRHEREGGEIVIHHQYEPAHLLCLVRTVRALLGLCEALLGLLHIVRTLET